MPSPFPGMDPFIESQKWTDFHHEYLSSVRAALIPKVRPKYVVDVEHYVFLARGWDEPDAAFAPDVSVVDAQPEWAGPEVSTGTTMMVEPVVCTLPISKRKRQAYLVIRDRQYRQVVTAIELLSPWNKAAGDGIKEYLAKRNNLLAADVNLVELDLLRGGVRLPTVETLPTGDYYVFVSGKRQRPKVDVYAWPLPHRLITIPLPLADGEPQVMLDLQEAFDAAYDRAGYDYSLDYHQAVSPPLGKADAAWLSQTLSGGDNH